MILNVNVCWIASIACLSFAFHGFQSWQQYSSRGMTRDFKSTSMRELFRDWNTLNTNYILSLDGQMSGLTNAAQSLQENAITVFGPRLYNSLPKYLRDIESVKTEKFKFELDKFLELNPDEPKMPNYVTASGSNSILDQLIHLRAQGIYHSGGVPDSAMEQSWLLRNHSK